MKPEEASQKIKDSYIPKMFTALEEALEVAIQALEKQVPKKGKVFFGGWLNCQNCEDGISGFEERPNYCPNCGQAIDWTEELE